LTSVATLLLVAWFGRGLYVEARERPAPPQPSVVVPGALLTALSAMVAFVLPWLGAPSIVGAIFAPAGLWSSAWPALLGAALIVVAWLIGSYANLCRPAVPPCDLLAHLAPLLARTMALGRALPCDGLHARAAEARRSG
jgi:hypothetical protein